MPDRAENQFRDGCKVHQSLSRRQSWAVFALGGVLVFVIVLGACLVGVLLPDGLYPVDPTWLQLLIWACLGGLIGGAARSLYFIKQEFGGHSGYCPSWYLDKWSLYIVKPFLGMIGGVALFLTAYVGFADAFEDATPPLRFFRVLLTSLGGGMFFEGAFAQLQNVLPERPGAAG